VTDCGLVHALVQGAALLLLLELRGALARHGIAPRRQSDGATK
jgi:hypothetical protein